MVKPHTVICSNLEDELRITTDKNNKILSFNELNGKLLLNYSCQDDEINNIGSLVRFSSYIAAIARTNLDLMMKHVGDKNIYYCDTDSVFISKIPDNEFLDNVELGKWKLEEKADKYDENIKYKCIINEAIFIAPKSYSYKIHNEDVYDVKVKGNRQKDI
jgi:hypothetical protein